MKLTKEILKKLILEAREEVANEATMQSVSDRISPTARPERTVDEFVVMSSDRGERSPAENKKMHVQFRRDVEAEGFTYTKLLGGWEETDEETGEKRSVVENSLIIYSDSADGHKTGMAPMHETELFEFGREMSEKYAQEAFIYGELVKARSGQRRIIAAYDQSGNDAGYGQWSSMEAVTKDAEFWSAVKGGGTGSPFQFKEDQEIVEVDAPDSVVEAYGIANKHKNKRLKFVRRNK